MRVSQAMMRSCDAVRFSSVDSPTKSRFQKIRTASKTKGPGFQIVICLKRMILGGVIEETQFVDPGNDGVGYNCKAGAIRC